MRDRARNAGHRRLRRPPVARIRNALRSSLLLRSSL